MTDVKSPTRKAVEFVGVLVTAVVLAVAIQAVLVKPYRIPSGSMEPTLAIGQRVLVDRLTHELGHDPGVGEIVVFHPPTGAETAGDPTCGAAGQGQTGGTPCTKVSGAKSSVNFIKRVVGVPGDRLQIRNDGAVLRNGRLEHTKGVRLCPGTDECNFPTAFRVPAGTYFMMGDNRGDSDDSRFWGPVPRKWIIGRAFATYWPLHRIGIL